MNLRPTRLQSKLLNTSTDEKTLSLYTGYDEKGKMNYNEAYYLSALSLMHYEILEDHRQQDGTDEFPKDASRSKTYTKHTFTITDKGRRIIQGAV